MINIKIRNILIFTILFCFIGVNTNPVFGTLVREKIDLSPINYGELSVFFIDVGQGDSIFIETPDDRHMLIDTGSKIQADKVIDFIDEKNVYKIDVFVATHPHEDHIGGVKEIFDEFDIESVYHPGYYTDTLTYQNFLDAIEKEGCPIYTDDELDPGDYIDFSYYINCQILHIDKNADDANAASIILRLDYDFVSFLFTGDIDKKVEEDITDIWNVDIDILKVAHHGSRTGSSDYFLSEATPKTSVICVGKDNSYGHPHIETLQRLGYYSTILRTDANGDITITTNGNYYSVDYEKSVDKPFTPIITGPTLEESGYKCNYSACSSDPEGENLYYTWDWGDGKQDLMIGPYRSGESCVNNHIWNDEGDYLIKVKATDELGYESEWGILEVSMPKKLFRNQFFTNIFERISSLLSISKLKLLF